MPWPAEKRLPGAIPGVSFFGPNAWGRKGVMRMAEPNVTPEIQAVIDAWFSTADPAEPGYDVVVQAAEAIVEADAEADAEDE